MIDSLILYDASTAGLDGYPLAWHETIKHFVRELAGNRCVRCKHPYKNGEHGRGEWSPCDDLCDHDGPIKAVAANVIYAQWRILTVHHLDGNKLNCRWWNLAALCQRCHLTIQGKVKLQRPYFLEHSEWFKPYVAGYYASTILGEELTREEVAARLDELLGLALRQMPEVSRG